MYGLQPEGTRDHRGAPVPRTLGGLMLDTLEALGTGALTTGARETLIALWDEGYRDGERLRDREVPGLAPAATVTPSSQAGPYPMMVATPHWRLMVAPEDGRARIVLGAEYLAASTTLDLTSELARVSWWLWGRADGWRLSRLDIACDVTGVRPDDYADLSACVRRTRGCSRYYADGTLDEATDERTSVYETRRAVETVTHGSAASRMQMCIYDKIAEAKAHRAEWRLHELRERGWDGETSVTRIEVRYRSRALDEFPGIALRDPECLHDRDKWMPMLWRYALERGVRYAVETRDTHRERWPMRADWRALANEGTVTPARRRTITEAQREESMVRASRDVVAGVVRLVCESPEAWREAMHAGHRAQSEGRTAIEGIVAVAMRHYAPLIEARVFGARDGETVASEWNHRMLRRREWVLYREDPSRALMTRAERAQVAQLVRQAIREAA